VHRLLVFCFAAGAAGWAASPPSEERVFGSLPSPSVSSWVLADFDGDNQIDVVTSRAERLPDHQYSHKVSLKLSGSPSTSFTFRDRYPSVELNSLDVDGDHDRDIIIRKTGSAEPLAVWLNDGSGHFLQGDLERFRAALEEHRSPGMELPRIDDDSPFDVSDPRIDPAVIATSVIRPEQEARSPRPEIDSSGAEAHDSERRSRAPPRNPRFL
jgi:hypothetical protein